MAISHFTTLSNLLTLLRAPLALIFLHDHLLVRLTVILLAMLSDALDGYVARRNQTVSRLGAVLDPLMDRFFVLFALSVLLSEGKLLPWQAFLMLFRDLVFFSFVVFVSLFGELRRCRIQATYWGKVTTFVQFCLLSFVTLGFALPWMVYVGFLGIGLMFFRELRSCYADFLKSV